MRALFKAACLLLLVQSGIAHADLKVFACEPEWAHLSKALGGEHVNVFSATTAQQDVHLIQPRPSLIAKYRQADLGVCTGSELEIGWLPVLQNTGGNPALRPGAAGLFFASEGLDMLEIPERLDRADGDVHPQGNPHVHMDPRNMIPISRRLAERMAQLDPGNAEHFAERQARFEKSWQHMISEWEALAAPLKGLKVVAHHKSFSYLFNWLGIEEVNNLEPKPGIPPSAAYLNKLMAELKSNPASMILVSNYQPKRPAEWLSERSGYPIVMLPGTVGGIEGADKLDSFFPAIINKLLAVQKAKSQ